MIYCIFYVFCFYHLPHLLSYSVLSIVEFVFVLYVHLPFCSYACPLSFVFIMYLLTDFWICNIYIFVTAAWDKNPIEAYIYLRAFVSKWFQQWKISLTIYHKNIYIKKTSETSLTQCRFSSSFRRRVIENYSTMCLSGKLNKSKMDWKHDRAVTKIKCYGREVWTQTGRKSCSL